MLPGLSLIPNNFVLIINGFDCREADVFIIGPPTGTDASAILPSISLCIIVFLEGKRTSSSFCVPHGSVNSWTPCVLIGLLLGILNWYRGLSIRSTPLPSAVGTVMVGYLHSLGTLTVPVAEASLAIAQSQKGKRQWYAASFHHFCSSLGKLGMISLVMISYRRCWVIIHVSVLF